MPIKRLLCFCLAIFLLVFTGCASGPTPPSQRVGVAIWDFEDMSPTGSPFPDTGELLAAKVIQVFEDTDKYQVVERERLLLALEELNLGTTDLVDKSNQLRLGQLVGAKLMVFGGYIVIQDTMRLELRLVSVESGKILRTATRILPATDISAWIGAAEESARELL
jgi:hypothetical protein